MATRYFDFHRHSLSSRFTAFLLPNPSVSSSSLPSVFLAFPSNYTLPESLREAISLLSDRSPLLVSFPTSFPPQTRAKARTNPAVLYATGSKRCAPFKVKPELIFRRLRIDPPPRSSKALPTPRNRGTSSRLSPITSALPCSASLAKPKPVARRTTPAPSGVLLQRTYIAHTLALITTVFSSTGFPESPCHPTPLTLRH
ncbi:hypothetical protein LZ30DRAFT_324252 [Colletotrichum cereale]|nr:hypothetical protein LZ30DRAFT_324252 [Colletotrichum cereale]